jgi:hypothetical protein
MDRRGIHVAKGSRFGLAGAAESAEQASVVTGMPIDALPSAPS